MHGHLGRDFGGVKVVEKTRRWLHIEQMLRVIEFLQKSGPIPPEQVKVAMARSKRRQ